MLATICFFEALPLTTTLTQRSCEAFSLPTTSFRDYTSSACLLLAMIDRFGVSKFKLAYPLFLVTIGLVFNYTIHNVFINVL
jgi:hypothetical protein